MNLIPPPPPYLLVVLLSLVIFSITSYSFFFRSYQLWLQEHSWQGWKSSVIWQLKCPRNTVGWPAVICSVHFHGQPFSLALCLLWIRDNFKSERTWQDGSSCRPPLSVPYGLFGKHLHFPHKLRCQSVFCASSSFSPHVHSSGNSCLLSILISILRSWCLRSVCGFRSIPGLETHGSALWFILSRRFSWCCCL